MPKLPGVSVKQAQRVFEKLGFQIERQGKHLIMCGIAKDAGLTPEQFRELL